MDRKTNLKRGIVVYILGLIITTCILTYFGRNLIHLYFNHEVIIGEVTGRGYPVGRRSSVTIFYSFYYNEREIKQKSTGFGITDSFKIGGSIILLYNPNTNTSYSKQQMIEMLVVCLFWIFFLGPGIPLVLIEIIKDIVNGNVTP